MFLSWGASSGSEPELMTMTLVVLGVAAGATGRAAVRVDLFRCCRRRVSVDVWVARALPPPTAEGIFITRITTRALRQRQRHCRAPASHEWPREQEPSLRLHCRAQPLLHRPVSVFECAWRQSQQPGNYRTHATGRRRRG